MKSLHMLQRSMFLGWSLNEVLDADNEDLSFDELLELEAGQFIREDECDIM